MLSRLGDWDVGSAGCATTPMVRMSTGDHGPTWACATRPSRSVATPKYQSARHARKQRSHHTIAGRDHNSVVQAAIIAPPLEHFIALLRRLKESHSKLGRKGNTMAWCLFEALRDDECKFLATEDSRAGGLLTPSGSLAGARTGAVWPCNWQPGKASGPLPRAGVVVEPPPLGPHDCHN